MWAKQLVQRKCLSLFLNTRLVYSASNQKFTEQNQQQALSQPLKGTIDPYNSIHLSESQFDFFVSNTDKFKPVMDSCIEQWKQNNVKAIWLKINTQQLNLLDQAIKCGFEMHHCTKEYVILNQWLIDDESSRLPHYASHYIGAGGLIINDKKEILLVQEKNGIQDGLWGIPGGLVNDLELVTEAAEREVREETGLDTEAYDMLMFSEVMNSRFNKADIYFVILLKLKDQMQQVTLQQTELNDYKWLKLKDIEEFIKTNRCGPIQYQTLNHLIKLQWANEGQQKPFFNIEQGNKVYFNTLKKYSLYQPYFQ